MKRSAKAANADKSAKPRVLYGAAAAAVAAKYGGLGPNSVITAASIATVAKEMQLLDLGQGVAAFLAQTFEYRLREILQDAVKVQAMSRRKTLTTDDVNLIMQLKRGQALIGYGPGVEKRAVTTADGTQQLAALKEMGERKEDLVKAMQGDLPRPLEPGLVLHWLAIDGVQPVIPHNPPPTQKSQDPAAQARMEGGALMVPERVHPISEELYAFYSRALKAIARPEVNEYEKNMIYTSLATDPGLHELVPYLSYYVHKVVDDAVGTKAKAVPIDGLWAVMKLVRCMVLNPYMHLELYLQQMLPSILTCIANNRLGGDHWPLRVFSAQTLAMIVKKYGNAYPDLPVRFCRTLAEQIDAFMKEAESGKGAVSMLYGCIVGIRHLGYSAVEVVLLPSAERLLAQLQSIMENRTAKARRRHDAIQCHTALLGAVGEYLERRQRVSPSVARVDMLGQAEGQVEISPGLWAEAMLPYAAQYGGYPEHLCSL